MTVYAKDRPGDLAAAGSYKTRECDDLASTHVERHVGKCAFASEPLHVEHDISWRGFGLREERAEVSADHRVDDAVDGDFFDGCGRDESTVAHDGDPLTA